MSGLCTLLSEVRPWPWVLVAKIKGNVVAALNYAAYPEDFGGMEVYLHTFLT